MTIYDNVRGESRAMAGVRQVLLVLLVLVLVVGALFVVSSVVPWFNPGIEYTNQGASGGENPESPVP